MQNTKILKLINMNEHHNVPEKKLNQTKDRDRT